VPVGGHNVLEPAAAGVPVVVGPHVANVASDVARLRARGAAVQADDADTFAMRAAELFLDVEAAVAAGRAATATVAELQGPLAVTLAIIRGTLASEGARA
jgi:3-deoxy-D-manno-octulosonic-acid transferase